MAGYQRKIAYLDYLENGMKIRNAGFVRIEGNGTQMRLELRTKGIPETFHGQYELKTDTDDTIGRISVSRGSGSCCVVWQAGAKQPEGKKTVQAEGVYIRLPGRHLLQAVWEGPLAVCVEAEGNREEGRTALAGGNVRAAREREPESVDLSAREDGRDSISIREPEGSQKQETSWEEGGLRQEPDRRKSAELQELIVQQKNIVPFVEKQPDRAESLREAQERPGQAESLREVQERPEQTENLRKAGEQPDQTENMREAEMQGDQVCYGDKWEQLTHMYPVIHPFGDEREYLSIAPKDFVVLRQEHQKMVHNSFLLHGYYNYKHLILGKIRKGTEWCYYLGVPGNFYGREKMVAEMFGFEAFEGEKEPVRAGDFGYFMKRVEI